MTDIDFLKIRAYDGSQTSGFEELVCQLAHLDVPSNPGRFVRKEGAGGDAGVECYWVLADDTETCWQAKYFTGGMNPSRWAQLDNSFKAALNKHPNMSTYVVCLPIDKTDSRKNGRGGKRVISLEDEWNAHVRKWSDAAEAAGRTVCFEFWGKHEIVSMLSIDDARFAGRRLYWFNEPVLRSGELRDLTQRSRDTLGERFSPEYHVDLPIVAQLDGLCANERWWSSFATHKESVEEFYEQLISWLKNEETVNDDTAKVLEFDKHFSRLIAILSDFLQVMPARQSLEVMREQVQELRARLRPLRQLIDSRSFDEQSKQDHFYHDFFGFDGKLRDMEHDLTSVKVRAYEVGAALIYGEAGIGKSHLLCDLAISRMEESLPTIFLLGGQYTGGNPLGFVRQNIDLERFSVREVLGAIDAAGDAARSRTLIVIDAINEGPHRDQWNNFLRGFLTEIERFEHISLLISCRSTYCRYIIPVSVDENCLVGIEHHGFQGFEHRAADRYLSNAGISKPSAPILAPEFTNPLFLKTCCKSLRASGERAFPRGLNGLTRLFDYYIDSVEATVAVLKQYNPAERIVQSVLHEFASRIYPDNLSGLPAGEARKIINEADISPLSGGGSLYNLLLHEGVLSEDISYREDGVGFPVIRFTYERFSDLFVARQIIVGRTARDVERIFGDDEPLGKIIRDRRLYAVAGIIEAIAVAIADEFHVEIVDVIPEAIELRPWEVSDLFLNTVLWRAPESFSERTLELLNSRIAGSSDRGPELDILLKLSTEPGHPWNARLLHRSLKDKDMAERDHFWSIHVARGDSDEGSGHEATERTIIEWACFGNIDDAEDERIRLCAIVLLWFLTASNRWVRDRATKSLVRLFSLRPEIIHSVFTEFCSVNDLYLVERLYAAVYGAACNVEDSRVIVGVASLVHDTLFSASRPVPHLLLRDYGRGVLELALARGVLPKAIDPLSFRPPYESDWPLENPSEAEVEQIISCENHSDIKSSTMGFPGDFGNYIMGCVHGWSATPINSPSIQTGYELKKSFADVYLNDELSDQFLDFLGPKVIAPVDIEALRNRLTQGQLFNQRSDDEIRREREERKAFLDRIREQLSEEEQEYFRWLVGLSNDRPAAFSRKWAQRWVCKRAYVLGWSEDLFSEFERSCSRGRGEGPPENAMERIGKKYQWIALHEFLAHLADNLHWIDRGYSDLEDRYYYGPWQASRRDIDPTNWLRKNGEYRTYHNETTTWWQPYRFPIDHVDELEEKQAFLWDRFTVPDFKNLLIVNDGTPKQAWSVLKGFWSQKQRSLSGDKRSPRLDCWFGINSVIVRESDFARVKDDVSEESLVDPQTVTVPATSGGFLGEYPWHPVYDSMSNWQDADTDYRGLIAVRHLVPVSEYSWEHGSYDHSIDSSLSVYLPARELVNDLGLVRVPGEFGNWQTGETTAFTDPSIKEYGPSYALMDVDALDQWLAANSLRILWLVGGEKQLFSSDVGASDFYGRLVFSGVYWMQEGKPAGDMYFQEERRDE